MSGYGVGKGGLGMAFRCLVPAKNRPDNAASA